MRIPDMGGLIIDTRRNRWYQFSASTGGGPIQFLMELENMSWKDAVETLLNEEGEVNIVFKPSNSIKEEKKDFRLPEKNDTYKHLFAYLVKTRMIHPKVVQQFVAKKLLYENKQHSCVFVGCDLEGTPRYASIRGTFTMQGKEAFKGEAAGSDKRFGFCRVGKGDTLFVCEAPIDVLSYMSIYKYRGLDSLIEQEHLLSLGCTADNALENYLQEHQKVTKIKLGLDNDKAGNEGCKAIFKKYSGQYQIQRIHMREKDMNEVLVTDMKRIAARQKELVMEKASYELEQEL
ncbi:DUF3991 domain-containing protein [[Clostridium] polysaccharolyticum]|nr:DUF3991 domain-containing protein [[Clostridium] polysaccharolyticum]